METNVSPFKLEKEDEGCIKGICEKQNCISLCIIAPFAPLRIAPKRMLSASFGYPDEFALEEFIELVIEKFPKKENRPPLFLLLHSPGGELSSSYMVARTLRQNFNKIVAFIPHIAASGATIVALGCDEIVMGNISRLSGIDPSSETETGTVSALSIVRAFKLLEKDLETKTLDEISYPYQHLVKSISAEKLDAASHSMDLVEGYAYELMNKAGYLDDEIARIVHSLLWEVEAHEEVISFDKAKEMGIKVKHYSDAKEYSETWKAMKQWLNKYFLNPSSVHFIKYCFPKLIDDSQSIRVNKDESINNKSGVTDVKTGS